MIQRVLMGAAVFSLSVVITGAAATAAKPASTTAKGYLPQFSAKQVGLKGSSCIKHSGASGGVKKAGGAITLYPEISVWVPSSTVNIHKFHLQVKETFGGGWDEIPACDVQLHHVVFRKCRFERDSSDGSIYFRATLENQDQTNAKWWRVTLDYQE
jgi:hypothetical protein